MPGPQALVLSIRRYCWVFARYVMDGGSGHAIRSIVLTRSQQALRRNTESFIVQWTLTVSKSPFQMALL